MFWRCWFGVAAQVGLVFLLAVGTVTAQTVLDPGAAQEGLISPAGDVDSWTFEVKVGDSIVLRAGEVTDQGGTGGFTPAIRLFGPGENLLGSSTANLDAVEVAVIASTGGTFTALISDGGSYTNGLGSYRLHLAQVPAEPVVSAGDEGGPLVDGSSHLGTIHLGDLDVWTFTAEVGDSIVLRAGEVSQISGTSGFTPALRLYGPNGALVDSDAANLDAVEVSTTASLSGTFTVVVSDGGSLRLYGPNGAPLGVSAANLNAVEVSSTATASGTFTVVVGDGGSYIDGSGTYRLNLAQSPGEPIVSPGDEGGPLTNGATVQGTIQQGELDMWTFAANAGDTIVLRVGEVTDTGGTGEFTPALRLYGPNGAALDADAGNLNAVEVATVASSSGTFTVVVGDGGSYLDGTGSYRLHLAVMPEQFSVSAGDEGGALLQSGTRQGSIDLGDLDLWSFEVNAGDNVTIRIRELNDAGGTGGFSPSIRVYNASGTLIGERAHATQAEVSFQATESGLHVVLVSDGGSYIDGVGLYELSATGLPEQGRQVRIQKLNSTSVQVWWPAALIDQVLQQNDTVLPEGWVDVGVVPANNGLSVNSIIQIGEGNRFFRLRPAN
ncbi:MAG: hypothetical protein ACYDC1_08040 [Limisphaerales bacterium]